MWFVMHTALKSDRFDLVEKAAKIIEKAIDMGWDHEFGGMFHFVDEKGGHPEGERKYSPFENMICDTWDTKLWWVHSEALYATMLAFTLTGRKHLKRMYEKIHKYVFHTFPNPDKEIGEWIQIRDRKGNPLNKIVALPVKDPFHILRNMLLMIDLLELEVKREGKQSWGSK
jgi:N-acylglucosamine 2-epimerase